MPSSEEVAMTDTAVKDKNPGDQKPHEFELIVNKVPKKWPQQLITGAEIKRLAESPADWVVNQIMPGPGEDPAVADDQKVDLDQKAPPPGVKKFTTRKPTTSPGSE
jgi:hypothetical protein